MSLHARLFPQLELFTLSLGLSLHHHDLMQAISCGAAGAADRERHQHQPLHASGACLCAAAALVRDSSGAGGCTQASKRAPRLLYLF